MLAQESLQTFPLVQLDLQEAIQYQFRLVDCVFRHFRGLEAVQDGDYGYGKVPGEDRPQFTRKVEETLAEFFESPAVALVQAGGTGAIRACLMAGLHRGNKVLLHNVPAYPTTELSMEFLSLEPVVVDMNRRDDVRQLVREHQPAGALVQRTRNKIDDRYDSEEVIATIREMSPRTFILADDSYAAMRVAKLGSQLGADVSAFSLFKLLGPPGLGCIVAGSDVGCEVVGRIRRLNMSGGAVVQGPQAMDALRFLTLTPVAMAVQAQVVREVATRLQGGEVAGVRTAYVANTNSLCVIVELDEPIAQRVLEVTERLGALRQGVGSESRVEVSAVFHEAFPYYPAHAFPWLAENRERLIRINPYRTGPETILRVLGEGIHTAQKEAPNR